MATEHQRLTNQLGTGQLNPRHEQRLVADGVQFAANFTMPDGSTFIVGSYAPDMYQRYVEQISKFYSEAHGLPARLRFPVVQPTP